MSVGRGDLADLQALGIQHDLFGARRGGDIERGGAGYGLGAEIEIEVEIHMSNARNFGPGKGVIVTRLGRCENGRDHALGRNRSGGSGAGGGEA